MMKPSDEWVDAYIDSHPDSCIEDAERAWWDEQVESNPSGKVFATEPISKLSIDESVTAYDIYFVAAFDFENPFGDEAEIEADGKTLYEAVLAEGSVTVSKISA